MITDTNGQTYHPPVITPSLQAPAIVTNTVPGTLSVTPSFSNSPQTFGFSLGPLNTYQIPILVAIAVIIVIFLIIKHRKGL